MIYTFNSHSPTIAAGCFIAPSAAVIGRTTLGNRVNVWYGAVIRADVNTIVIGDETNIQDNAVLHVTDDKPLVIGSRCTVGHAAIIHACTVGDNALIGMGAIILDGAVIGSHCLVGAGAVVPPNKSFPPRSLLLGAPAKVVRTLTEEELEAIERNTDEYLLLSTGEFTVVDTMP
jgi:carbonic anhydrase/acetyltransferase-like protein (isoleucine patch superfamily)